MLERILTFDLNRILKWDVGRALQFDLSAWQIPPVLLWALAGWLLAGLLLDVYLG